MDESKSESYVIGSGPSGVFAAIALIEAGHKVVMLDAGSQLDAAREAWAREASSQVAPERLLDYIVGGIETASISARGIPDKHLFGSDYMYRAPSRNDEVLADGFDQRASFATGGLSNVWGAAMMPYRAEDLATWPLTVQELEPHYRRVVALTGLSAAYDDLSSQWPLYGDTCPPLPKSLQAAGLEVRCRRNKKVLSRLGIAYGGSRLAVKGPTQPSGCRTCACCLYGCVYDCIWKSSHLLASLQSHERFTFSPDVVVETVEETGDSVNIRSRNRITGTTKTDLARRVFVATGLINTTRIMLRSLGLYHVDVEGIDSQYFLIPALISAPSPPKERRRQHTLSQLFLEIDNPGVSAHGIHLQVYSYNDMMSHAVRNSLRFLGPLAGPLTTCLDRHLVVLQGYLDSRESSVFRFVLRRAGQADELFISGKQRPRSAAVVRGVAGLLTRAGIRLGLIPLYPMIHVAAPGRGYHSGGTFPMSAAGGRFCSDTLGRPFGLKRVHLVDSSVFPSIAATTITMTVMANSHRIATLAARI